MCHHRCIKPHSHRRLLHPHLHFLSDSRRQLLLPLGSCHHTRLATTTRVRSGAPASCTTTSRQPAPRRTCVTTADSRAACATCHRRRLHRHLRRLRRLRAPTPSLASGVWPSSTAAQQCRTHASTARSRAARVTSRRPRHTRRRRRQNHAGCAAPTARGPRRRCGRSACRRAERTPTGGGGAARVSTARA